MNARFFRRKISSNAVVKHAHAQNAKQRKESQMVNPKEVNANDGGEAKKRINLVWLSPNGDL